MFLDQAKSPNSFKKDRISEKPIRSVVKAISWRIIGTLDTIFISWLITGEATTALAIGSIELITKMALYVGHERIWNRINFGKKCYEKI